MKKLLLSSALFLIFNASQSQTITSENFDVFPASWTKLNQSAPAGANNWDQATQLQTPYFPGGAQNGASDTSYAFVNFNSTVGSGTISNWLITPSTNLQNGDVISFYSRKGLSGGAIVYSDRMEVRISTNGDFSVNPSGATSVGDFTTLALTINPTLTTTGYPTAWTQYSYTVSGLTSPTGCKIAFRYFVTAGGPTGANSDYIAIDAYSVNRPLATNQFFTQNFNVFPNPANQVINVSSKNNAVISSMEMTDLNGRVVKQLDGSVSQINISELTSGVYFLKVSSDLGSGSTKIVKQ